MLDRSRRSRLRVRGEWLPDLRGVAVREVSAAEFVEWRERNRDAPTALAIHEPGVLTRKYYAGAFVIARIEYDGLDARFYLLVTT
jgi:hypothetical protein